MLYGMLLISISVGKDWEARGTVLMYLCVCVCVTAHICLVCVQFLPLKQSRGQRLVCTNVKCVCGCVVSQSATKAIKKAEACMFGVCVSVCALGCFGA